MVFLYFTDMYTYYIKYICEGRLLFMPVY